MNIFSRKTKRKHIEQFEHKIVKLLELELPQLKKAVGISKLYGISFIHKPKGIFLTRGYGPKAMEEINRNHKTLFNLRGISIWNRTAKNYMPITLNFQHDALTKIEIEDPEYFHKTFDLNQIQKNEIRLEQLPMENPDKKIAEKLLTSLTPEQIELLELDHTFEIELDEKRYYTILDMEDGNYIAIDKEGKVYRLNHDHEERIKLIAHKPTAFFETFSGQKSDLEKMMNE